MEWQAIETAPKDGNTKILVGRASKTGRQDTQWDWIILGIFDEAGLWECFNDSFVYNQFLVGRDSPTHWMPLPDPPK